MLNKTRLFFNKFLKMSKDHFSFQKKIKFFEIFVFILLTSYRKQTFMKNILIVCDQNLNKSFFVDKNYLIKISNFVFLILFKI